MNSFNFIKLHILLVTSNILIVTFCAPLSKDSEATILNYNNTNDGTGNYYFRFETSNGITREEKGTLVDVGLPNEHISVEGKYSYINEEGITETFNYIANENGYTILTSPQQPIFVSQALPPAVIASLLGK
ncbi:unnamed protein product [Euphydryas editha]|uniref:Uncharacterized protein n=1 Tax=Euphydryas editha TaxID=104508 RepID=A0AAU9VB35_EUPED|nr:unnamed protein product [Euphydryas editha]